jgi:hypothetical protein
MLVPKIRQAVTFLATIETDAGVVAAFLIASQISGAGVFHF